MKKIMFNERYGLEQAVIEGKKTMTRRIIKPPKMFKGKTELMLVYRNRLFNKAHADCVICDSKGHNLGLMPLPYDIGDVVAISQRYRNLIEQGYLCRESDGWVNEKYCLSLGYYNKMFVKAEYMPWQIVIDNLWFERLQDICEADIMREGIKIKKGNHNGERPFGEFTFDGWDDYSFTAREAFAALIDRVCGRGTWDSNPWVVAYVFHLQRSKCRHSFLK